MWVDDWTDEKLAELEKKIAELENQLSHEAKSGDNDENL